MTPYCPRFHISADDFEWTYTGPLHVPTMVCKKHGMWAPQWVHDEMFYHTERNIEQLLTGQEH